MAALGINQDTIAALATPPGNGGVAVIRISGTLVPDIIAQLTRKKLPARTAVYTSFLDIDNVIIDSGIALYFPAPASFTGEDVLELHGHGGSVISNMLLKRVLALGARLAQPGEFSQRAFLNNKIDLVQAEAIADLIVSHSEQAVRSAQQSLQGVFSKQINGLVDELTELRIYIEAAIDFVDEEINFFNRWRGRTTSDAFITTSHRDWPNRTTRSVITRRY
ncbi:tRNA modification GTPase [Methylocucumis oryzae]|uniref:tRNA modification GTPase n=1 Tax=Methylocucumis oryzae TaxID=1632867 RepID=UPI000AC5FA9C